VIESPSGGVPEKVPRWDLTKTKTCGGGKVFLVCPLVFGEYLGIYRRIIRVRGATGAPQAWGAHPGACPLSLSPPRGPSRLLSKLLGCLVVQEKSSKSFISLGLCLVLIFCRRQKTRKKQQLALGTKLVG